MFDLGGPAAEVGVAELADDAQVCNCNGVSKGAICGVVKAGCKTVAGVMEHDAGREGLRVVQAAGRPGRRVRRRRGRGGGPVGPLLRARHRDGQADPDGDHPGAAADVPVGGVRGAGPGRRRGRQVQDGPGLAAEDDVGRGLRRREGRPVHQRPGARQHPEGRHLLGRPADARRGDHPGAAAADRRRGRQVPGADGQAHRRPADRPAGHPEGGPARGVVRPRDAVGLRVREVLPDGQDLRGPGVLPLRHRGLHQARGSRSRPGCRAWRARPR